MSCLCNFSINLKLFFKHFYLYFQNNSFEKCIAKWNPSALLVGMQTGAATVENSMEFAQKTKNGTAF